MKGKRILVIEAFILLAAAAYFLLRPQDPAATYVLKFDHVYVHDPKAFINAVSNAHPRWQRDLTFDPGWLQDGLQQNYTDSHLPLVPETPPIANKGPGQHVTQRIGLFSKKDYDAVMSSLLLP